MECHRFRRLVAVTAILTSSPTRRFLSNNIPGFKSGKRVEAAPLQNMYPDQHRVSLRKTHKSTATTTHRDLWAPRLERACDKYPSQIMRVLRPLHSFLRSALAKLPSLHHPATAQLSSCQGLLLRAAS